MHRLPVLQDTVSATSEKKTRVLRSLTLLVVDHKQQQPYRHNTFKILFLPRVFGFPIFYHRLVSGNREKAAFMFDMFDFEGRREVSYDELAICISTVVGALSKVGR